MSGFSNFAVSFTMADDIAAVQLANADERQLHELGYAQELRNAIS